MTGFELSDADKAGATWLRLKAHLTERLAMLRAKNDDPDMGQFQTAVLRGQIQTLKGIIALGDDRPPTDE